jgi:hypothetical protein
MNEDQLYKMFLLLGIAVLCFGIAGYIDGEIIKVLEKDVRSLKFRVGVLEGYAKGIESRLLPPQEPPPIRVTVVEAAS